MSNAEGPLHAASHPQLKHTTRTECRALPFTSHCRLGIGRSLGKLPQNGNNILDTPRHSAKVVGMSKEQISFPETLYDAIKYFANGNHAFNFMRSIRWPDGVVKCPRCGSKDVFFLSTRKIWKCKSKHEKQQFSVKVGTVLEDSPIALDKWLSAFWLIANAKNGISSYELHRSIGVTQKTAWFMLHRIRLAMQDGSIEKFPVALRPTKHSSEVKGETCTLTKR